MVISQIIYVFLYIQALHEVEDFFVFIECIFFKVAYIERLAFEGIDCLSFNITAAHYRSGCGLTLCDEDHGVFVAILAVVVVLLAVSQLRDADRDGFGSLAREVFPYPAALARLAIMYAWGRQQQLRVDRALEDGDDLEAGRSIQVVALPGHTTGHAGYWIPDVSVLVTGDLIDFENSQGMDLNNPRSDFGMALGSLRRALELKPEILIPAHGEPTVGRKRVEQVLTAALAGGIEYPERIREVLGARTLRLDAITPVVFPDVPLSMRAMTMMLVLVVLLHMERTGQVRRTEVSGRPAWVRVD